MKALLLVVGAAIHALLVRIVRKLKSLADLQFLLAGAHLLIAWSSYHRPNMLEMNAAYSQFLKIGPTSGWGVVALLIGLGLLVLPRATPVLLIWQAFSASFFLLFTLLVTTGNGLTYGSVIYGMLTLASAVTAYRTSNQLFQRTRSPQRLRNWVERRHG